MRAPEHEAMDGSPKHEAMCGSPSVKLYGESDSPVRLRGGCGPCTCCEAFLAGCCCNECCCKDGGGRGSEGSGDGGGCSCGKIICALVVVGVVCGGGAGIHQGYQSYNSAHAEAEPPQDTNIDNRASQCTDTIQSTNIFTEDVVSMSATVHGASTDCCAALKSGLQSSPVCDGAKLAQEDSVGGGVCSGTACKFNDGAMAIYGIPADCCLDLNQEHASVPESCLRITSYCVSVQLTFDSTKGTDLQTTSNNTQQLWARHGSLVTSLRMEGNISHNDAQVLI